MAHVRAQRRSGVPEISGGEAFMMHTSTSPQYAILAFLDVGARMMMGKAGERLVHEAVECVSGGWKNMGHRKSRGVVCPPFEKLLRKNVYRGETIGRLIGKVSRNRRISWRGGRWPCCGTRNTR
ncbi:hypothetical protein [Kyrpidia tusciae]|uniref:hypothetical protein n=1 Tax=Kyrpidia tusciae TaxID=33943 RepID=UPI000A01AA3C